MHWSWQRWTLQKAVHTKMSDIAKYHKVWKQQEKLLKPSQISSIHSMCMTTTICIASHLVPPQPRTLKICYQSVKWEKRPSSHSSRSCWLTVKRSNAPLKRQMLNTFANVAKSAKVTRPRKNKQLTAQRNVFGQLILLSLKHEICKEWVNSYPLRPVPWPLYSHKWQHPYEDWQSQVMRALENDSYHVVKPNQRHITYIINGCALFRAQVALPTTFGELTESILDQLPKVELTDFITDKYEALSIKAIERMRRGSTKPHLINGSLIKIPRDWKAFLSCNQNKQSLISFLLKEWKQNK